ncbi:hypothetical protein [Microcoleus sp. FACHB-672]|nr:hypothetical protein [Microcoleus sp. FACHB-672]MBD2040893.1 hypothetical protein [Microcoleus sp. FACHB-672]
MSFVRTLLGMGHGGLGMGHGHSHSSTPPLPHSPTQNFSTQHSLIDIL